ncbi:patched domain-containing protein 3 [Elysia marginata]|uniref:Patched domain-containing protein 3 n=1 Tax=Elysia marginata TaxID=1093978 RepID=A0AAV4EQG8_9GAST|nr:patched domain-containing protein 3 [Elysia marginata]
MSAVGVKFVNISGVMPFLTLGIGVDDMFLLMSGWSETLSFTQLTVPERIGTVFKKAGIGITITSAVTVLLCYITNASIFGACLTLHGRRVFSRRHTFTCLPVSKSREHLQAEGGACYAMVCSGEIPTRPSQDQSICEKGPQAALTKVLMLTPVRMLVLLLFAIYLGVAIWGCTTLKQGLDLKNIVLTSSYFYKYQAWLQTDFGEWIPVSFVTVGAKVYSSAEALKNMQDLLSAVHKHPSMDPDVESCWLTSLAKTNFYNTSSDSAFISGLHEFLAQQTRFYNDVVFDSTNETIIASRCHASSTWLIDSNDEKAVMNGAREIADASPANVFAYAEAFVLIEQYVTILWSTFKTVGSTLAVMLVVTIVFLPQPVIVGLVMFQVIMILVGVFGFMAFWDLTLSSVTMVLLIMSVGFSVDFW